MILNWLKCKLGFHHWGEIEKGPVKIIGPHILFVSWSEQRGTRTCSRCGKVQKVIRSGFVGDDNNPSWKKE